MPGTLRLHVFSPSGQAQPRAVSYKLGCYRFGSDRPGAQEQPCQEQTLPDLNVLGSFFQDKQAGSRWLGPTRGKLCRSTGLL